MNNRVRREIGAREFKLVFDWIENQGGYGYTLWTRDKENIWQRRSATGNPLVRGRSFDLFPAVIQEEYKDVWSFQGKKEAKSPNGDPYTYAWEGTLRIHPESDWLEIRIDVHNPSELQLQMIDGYEPEITIDMGLLPPYDRGDHVWFKTNINNPTKWNDEAYGNDFPALYYYDSYYHYDLMMFFDMTEMSWMSRDNIARFLNYRCGFRRKYKPQPVHELGMYADGFSGHRFPEGKQTFKYYLKARTKPKAPKETTALQELVDQCLQLIPAETRWPEKSTDWEDFTERCTADLMDPQCWNSNEIFDDFILNYVNGYSPAWQEAFEAKNLTIDFKSGPCIDSAAWISFPLAIVNELKSNQAYRTLHERILKFTQAYVKHKVESEAASKQSGNAVYREGMFGTWQYVYILEQIWQVANLNRDTEMLDYVYREVEEVLIPFSRNVQYLYPLAFDMASLQKFGNGDGYAIAGLYSYFMLNLYKTTDNERYLQEAERAIKPLIQLPVNSLSQEAFLLSIGLQAASELWKLTNKEIYREIYQYLVAQNLRMMYWYDDNTQEEYKDYNIFGMFQACTPIIYPAFFENIECLSRLASTLDVHPASKGLLRVFNHARKNNMYMFPQCLPENRHSSSLKYIPFENVGILEDEKTGWIGQEIYGCGQVYEAYLMWEAFGKSSDRDVMVLNVNNYKFMHLDEVRNSDLMFIVYNPEGEEKAFDIRITENVQWKQAWYGNSIDACHAEIDIDGPSIPLRLKPDQFIYLKLTR